ncbi:MAG: hypothetical protein QW115_04230 [Thermoplasmata archaeon]
MNSLARKIVKVLEESPLGSNGIHLYTRQCEEAGINPEAIRPEQLPLLLQRLKVVLPLFAGSESEAIIRRIAAILSTPDKK